MDYPFDTAFEAQVLASYDSGERDIKVMRGDADESLAEVIAVLLDNDRSTDGLTKDGNAVKQREIDRAADDLAKAKEEGTPTPTGPGR